MKSILVIGMGRFGRHLAMEFLNLGNEVMIVDRHEKNIEELAPIFSDSMIGDCTNENVLKSIGVQDFDICFVTIGENYSSEFEITSLLKDLGAKYIVTKAGRDRHVDLLKKLGADDVIYPERLVAEKIALRYHSNTIYDMIKVDDKVSIFEVSVPESWISKDIKKLNVRQKYGINIVSVKSGNDVVIPSADYVFKKNDNVVLIGPNRDVMKIIK